ncbi:MAG TPA: thioredoxin fold domain-containing protein [Candidatus Kapabacteria bacterium]|jgi:thioredoxin-related protein|nr:thioredoxin fold domain-containing protein [Candidatus Kapabacteria bacterium]
MDLKYMRRISITSCALLVGASIITSFGSQSCSKEGVANHQTANTVSSSNAKLDAPFFVSFEDAFARAKDENKLVMVDVYTDWCGWCKRLDKDVYTDPAVQQEVSKYFTAVKLNAESNAQHTFAGKPQSETELAQSWGVKGFPTILFLTPDEKVVQIIPGYVPAKDFVSALKFIGTGAYKTQDFESWKKANG